MARGKNEFFPEMVRIPPGEFLMGSDDGMDNEKPVHRVRLEGFWIGKFPVTNREYRSFLDAIHAAPPPFLTEAMFADPEKPVVGVRWHDAAAFCDWLAAENGKKIRLPSEAEWERAARGGVDGKKYPWGDTLPPEEVFPGCDVKHGGPARVGATPPNGFGLYDMCASVHEWCGDFYDPNFYRISPPDNPAGPPSGARKVSRGGSWRHRIKFSRSAARSSLIPSFKYADYGFRVVALGL